jgi:hypothetical protein
MSTSSGPPQPTTSGNGQPAPTTPNAPPAWRTRGRYVLSIVLPMITTATGYAAAVTHGVLRLDMWIVAVLCTAGTAILGTRRDVRGTAASAAAIRAKAALETAILQSGQPIANSLNRISLAGDDEKLLVGAVNSLLTTILQTAYRQCGRAGEKRGEIRSVFYLLTDNDTLERVEKQGRGGNALPRQCFRRSTPDEEAAVELALHEDAVIINGIKKRSYKELIAVPVRAGNTSFGMLCVDSDAANSLTKVDVDYMQLLATFLAAGIGRMGDDRMTLLP